MLTPRTFHFLYCSDTSVVDILIKLKLPSDVNIPSNCLNINKDTALEQMMAAVMSDDFNPCRKLNIKFDGDVGIDNGALTDTFMELCKVQLPQLKIFHTADDGLRLVFDRKGK